MRNNTEISAPQDQIMTSEFNAFVEEERNAIREFFSEENLNLENLPYLLEWLDENRTHYLAQSREWIATFLIKSYRRIKDKEAQSDFLRNLEFWLSDMNNKDMLEMLDVTHAEIIPGIVEETCHS